MARRHLELCRLAELPVGSSRGFALPAPWNDEIFLVRTADGIFAYRNSCPHTGGPLDWVPDQFLDLEGKHIQCATHAALFRIEDGACISGPCAGQSLRPVEVRIDNQRVMLVLQPGPERGRKSRSAGSG